MTIESIFTWTRHSHQIYNRPYLIFEDEELRKTEKLLLTLPQTLPRLKWIHLPFELSLPPKKSLRIQVQPLINYHEIQRRHATQVYPNYQNQVPRLSQTPRSCLQRVRNLSQTIYQVFQHQVERAQRIWRIPRLRLSQKHKNHRNTSRLLCDIHGQ